MSKRSIVIMILLVFLASMVTATPVVAKEDTESLKRGYLGVYVQDIDRDIKEAMDLESKRGVLIRDVVEDSPADQAGIEQEDIILEFGGKKVRNSSHFTKLVKESSPGEEVAVTIIRDGNEKILSITMGERLKDEFLLGLGPEYFLGKTNKFKPYSYSFTYFSGSRIGIKVQDLTEQLGNYFGVEEGEGVLITEVEEDMPAYKAGVKAGDVIVGVDAEKVEDTEDLMEVISEKEEGEKVGIKVIRNRKPESFEVEVKEGEKWFSSDLSDINKLKIYTEKLNPSEIFLQKEHSSELKEELEDLREELEELKGELEELREKIR
jgi:serine protease Do